MSPPAESRPPKPLATVVVPAESLSRRNRDTNDRRLDKPKVTGSSPVPPISVVDTTTRSNKNPQSIRSAMRLQSAGLRTTSGRE